MSLRYGWKNVGGTAKRDNCDCGSWKEHWVEFTNGKFDWPEKCSIEGCNNEATSGLHMRNIDSGITGEKIIPGCASCNSKRDIIFDLVSGTVGVIANRQKTCDTRHAELVRDMRRKSKDGHEVMHEKNKYATYT